MAGIIVPAHHQKPFLKEDVKILGVRSVDLQWYWDVENVNTVTTGFVDYRIELIHEMPWGSKDVSWFVYEPGTGVQYKGPQQGFFGTLAPLEAQGFFALKNAVRVSPGRKITVLPGTVSDAQGGLRIPGGQDSPAAYDFWGRMLRQFRRGLKFHLDVKLYAHDGTGSTSTATSFHWDDNGATELGSHRWENIFEVDD